MVEVATCSLSGHNSLPDAYDEDKNPCYNNDPINTVNAHSSEHSVSVCARFTGTDADDLQWGSRSRTLVTEDRWPVP